GKFKFYHVTLSVSFLSVDALKGRRKERERGEDDRDGSRRSSQGFRGALLHHLRFESCRIGLSLPGRIHVDLRRAEDPGLSEHRRQAHQPSFPAVQAQHHHRRLPALWSRRRHARLCLRQSSARWRTARSQVQPDVPFGIESGKLLRVQRHIQVELCLRNLVAETDGSLVG
uniref:Uncharacterized protein n=2 Tax=Brassica oleracea TaxID=3712 RepID=A0A0D3CDZ8_BRAOL